MIAKITIAISSEHPNLPLDTAATFVGSAATFSITGVPTLPAISVAAVAVSVTNAIGAVSTVAAVSGEDGWTATFPASHFAAAGTVKDGVVVAVSGTDENGVARTWTAGVGTIVILSSSPVPAPGDVVYNVRLFDEEPDAPTDGDVWPDGDGGYVIWQDGEAHALGGGSSVTVDAALSSTSENPVQNKVVTAALDGKLTREEAVAGFTEWCPQDANPGYAIISTSYSDGSWNILVKFDGETNPNMYFVDGAQDAVELTFEIGPDPTTIERTRLPTMADIPTDNAQLANGAGYATTAAMNAALAQKADASSLPYALVTVTPTAGAPFVLAACFPIKYEDANTSVAHTVQLTDISHITVALNETSGKYEMFDSEFSTDDPICLLNTDGTYHSDGPDTESIAFGANDTPAAADTTQVLGFTLTAQLIDRAINAVSLSAAATLVFPAQTAGKARDFVVRLTLTETNNAVPSVTFPADVAYETEGGEWPDLTEAGTYIVRLTEVPTVGVSETARFFLQCSSAVADATPPSAGGES